MWLFISDFWLYTSQFGCSAQKYEYIYIYIYLTITAELWTQFWQRMNCAIFFLLSEFTSYSSLRIEEKVKMVIKMCRCCGRNRRETADHSRNILSIYVWASTEQIFFSAHAHSHKRTHSLSHTHTHTHTTCAHALSHACTQTHRQTDRQTHSLTHTHTHTHTQTRAHAHSLTRACAHTHTLSLTHTC